ncbi:MAG: hypothetical protein LBI55_01520 [Oscillospiraceae bacterium]|jgi:hypothetical protein|nr:hypothetical protein [Oscillospiraceae bacterium]
MNRVWRKRMGVLVAVVCSFLSVGVVAFGLGLWDGETDFGNGKYVHTHGWHLKKKFSKERCSWGEVRDFARERTFNEVWANFQGWDYGDSAYDSTHCGETIYAERDRCFDDELRATSWYMIR